MLNICRLCLATSFVNTSIDDDNCDLIMKITCCLPFKLSPTDGLPNRICDNCVRKIDEINQYYNSIMNVDNQLRSLLASGLDALTSFYDGILEVGNPKENPDIKITNIESVLIQEPPRELKLTKLIKTVNDIEIKLEDEKEEIDDDNSDGLKYEVDLVTETEVTSDEYDSDDNILLIKFASKTDVKIKPNISKRKLGERHDSEKTIGKKSEQNNLENDSNVGIERKHKKSEGKATKDVKKSEETASEWQCLTCFLYMSSRLDLMQHYKDHVKNLKANENASEADTNTDLSTAVINGDSEECDDGWVLLDILDLKPYQCKKCHLKFCMERDVREHMLRHLEARPYVCNLCGKTFKCTTSIVEHSRAHSTTQLHYCTYKHCDYTSLCHKDLKEHKKKMHKLNFQCKSCTKSFNVQSVCVEHENKHTTPKPFACDVCDKTFASTRLLLKHRTGVHPRVKTPAPLHRCVECGKQFPTLHRLVRHQLSHTGQKTVLCNICGKRLTSEGHLKIHIAIHEGDKRHICKTCGKGFVEKYNLTLHYRVHTGERPHVCHTCGKGFSQRSSLTIHKRIHSGDRPYVCHLCNKGFTAKGLLSMHAKYTCI